MKVKAYLAAVSPPSTKRFLTNLLLAGAACCTMTAYAQQTASESAVDAAHGAPAVAARFPKGSIQSVEKADQALLDVTEERNAVEKKFKQEEQACYSDFFVNSCKEKAQERRRVALKQLRPVEVEANAFKRRVKAEEQDRALAERNAQKDADLQKRLPQEQQQQQQQQQGESRRQAKAPSPQANPSPVETPAVSNGQSERVIKHNEKLRRQQTEEAAKEEKRAAKVAAYEKKVRESEARQQEVEKRKQEKERKRAASASKQSSGNKQGSAAKSADANPQEAAGKSDAASQQK